MAKLGKTRGPTAVCSRALGGFVCGVSGSVEEGEEETDDTTWALPSRTGANINTPPSPPSHHLVTKLEKVGYESGVTLRAATNDFRSAGVPEALDYQYVEETRETQLT